MPRWIKARYIMKILLTNDDGIYAPGLSAMAHALQRLGEVFVIAPSHEQSGVSHSITFLTPLTVKRVFVNNEPWGWAVDGSPADCVKLGATQIMPEVPDIVVSGINSGLNAGANILYSGTVGAAVEGSFFGITSFAVSLEYDENEPFHRAAEIASNLIEKICDQESSRRQLYNINIPISALREKKPQVVIAPIDTSPYWESFEQRVDPMGRQYFWLTGRPDPRQPKTPSAIQQSDLQSVSNGLISLTPLDYNLTKQAMLSTMESWNLDLDDTEIDERPEQFPINRGPSIRTTMRQ